MPDENNRSKKRVEVNKFFPGAYQTQDITNPKIKPILLDISQSGLRLEIESTYNIYNIGEEVSLKIEMPSASNKKEIIYVKAVCRWSKKTENKLGSFEFGFEIIERKVIPFSNI